MTMMLMYPSTVTPTRTHPSLSHTLTPSSTGLVRKSSLTPVTTTTSSCGLERTPSLVFTPLSPTTLRFSTPSSTTPIPSSNTTTTTTVGMTSTIVSAMKVARIGGQNKGNVLSLPTELLSTIFELAVYESPFLLAKETRPKNTFEYSAIEYEENDVENGDPAEVVEEIHCTAPMDKWDHPLSLHISQVCARFRHVALSTPLIWSRISFYREPRPSSKEGPQRWNLQKLFLSRATKPFIKADGTLGSEREVAMIPRGILDVRIFAAMYTNDEWDENTINEKWFGAVDMNEICDLILPFSPILQSFTLSSDTYEPIYTFIHRSQFLRARNLERIELIRTNVFPGKQEEFYPVNLGASMRLFSGVEDENTGEDKGVVEEGSLGKMRECIFVGAHVDWKSLLLSLRVESAHGKFTNLETLYLNYLAWNIRPSLPIFLSFLTSSPYLTSLGLQAGGPDPHSTEAYDIDPDAPYVAPWREMLPAHPTIPTLSHLKMLLLKYLEVEEAVEIFAVLKAIIDSDEKSYMGGRLRSLKTLHLGDLGGGRYIGTEWETEMVNLGDLVEEMGGILPLTSSSPSPSSSTSTSAPSTFTPNSNGKAKTGLQSLSLTGYKTPRTHSPTSLETFQSSLFSLTAMENFNDVKSLRLVACDELIFKSLYPRLSSSSSSNMQIFIHHTAFGLGKNVGNSFTLPMKNVKGLYLERCEGTGYLLSPSESDTDIVVDGVSGGYEKLIQPIKGMLNERNIYCSERILEGRVRINTPGTISTVESLGFSRIEYVGYARKDLSRVHKIALAEMIKHVPHLAFYGREEGEVEGPYAEDADGSDQSQLLAIPNGDQREGVEMNGETREEMEERRRREEEEEDERMIREAEEYDDPEFEMLCEAAYERAEAEWKERRGSVSHAPNNGAGAGAGLGVPGLIYTPNVASGSSANVMGTAPLPMPLEMTVTRPDEMEEEELGADDHFFEEDEQDDGLPTPRNIYQSFFTPGTPASYFSASTSQLRGGEFFSNNGEGFDTETETETASISTRDSNSHLSPSSSSSSLSLSMMTSTTSVSTAPPSTTPSLCGDYTLEEKDSDDPASDDTAPAGKKSIIVGVGVPYTSLSDDGAGVDFELDDY